MMVSVGMIFHPRISCRKVVRQVIQKRTFTVKKSYVLAVLCLVFVIGLFGIHPMIAYLSDADDAVNDFIIGGNTIELIETFIPPEELTPGVSFTKDVSVYNTGESDCYVRIKAVFTDSDMEKYCSVNYNTNNFIYNADDGFWYYTDVLKSGTTSPSLFTTVSLDSDMSSGEIKDFDILVYTESYQSKGFDDYESAWTHYARNHPNN